MAVVFAKFSAHVTESVQLHAGDAWNADDPLVRAHPDWFADTPANVKGSSTSAHEAPAVETATADPGEKRTRTTR